MYVFGFNYIPLACRARDIKTQGKVVNNVCVVDWSEKHQALMNGIIENRSV